ncbi:DUF2285 domain-containing protein [Acidovorax sp. SUPP950]|nr:DUF2285 domain-containing protein [Acidovorax sp. SUPP950]
MLQVRASRAPDAASGFDLWRVPGRKRLALGGGDLTLTAELPVQRLQFLLAGDVKDGVAYACAVPLTHRLRGQLDGFNAQARVLDGHEIAEARARPATRSALLHLRALQALDAMRAGASHRDVAQVLFGLREVVLRWREDGELRAQVRHLLRRAEAYVNGGYLALAGVRRTAAERPGDERLR